nr:flavonol synthase [Ziziphora clinopodioides subsp. bungeana]
MEVERVQSIASLSKQANTIPSEFIRSENEQPAASTLHGVVLEIPVIDLGLDSDHEKITRLISEASQEWGIFQVVNHGIPDEAMAKLQRVGREFFELPKEEKELIAKTPDSGIEGEVNEEYAKKVLEVSEKVMTWLSVGLGLEEKELKAAMGGEDTIYLMKINYYPPCPRPDLALGVVAHTDMSAVTILVPNEVQGLQVFRDDHWYDVKYIPNALIIHIGDQLQILSNGKYKAVYHRTTVNKERTRMSWPVFLEPPPEFEIGPISKLVNEENPAKYKTKKYKDYVYCKLNKIPQ